MSDVEQLLVLARAIDIRDGNMTLDEAAEHVRRAPLTPDDTASIRRVSSAVRHYVDDDPTTALVFATLNDIVADRSGDADLRALTRFDLANVYIGHGRLDEALPILDGLHHDLVGRDLRGVPYEAIAANRAAVRAHVGDIEEGIAALRELIADAERTGRVDAVARCRLNIAATYERADRLGEALAEYDRAMRDVREALAGDRDTSHRDRASRELEPMLLGASLGAGRIASGMGDHAGAVERAMPVVELALALNDPQAAWDTLTLLGSSLAELGQAERAAHAFGTALDVHVETGIGERPEEVARSMVVLFRSLGHSDEAAARLAAHADRARQLERLELQAWFAVELAELYAADGDVDRALETFRHACDYFDAAGAPELARRCLLRAGGLLSQAGRIDVAHSTWADGLARAEAADDLLTQVDILAGVGRADALRGNNVRAAETLRRAAALVVPLADAERTTEIDSLLGGVLLAIGDPAGAAERYERAADACHSVRDRHTEALMRCGLADAYVALARGEDAFTQARAALEIGRHLDDSGLVAEASAALGHAHEMQNRPADALDHFARAVELAVGNGRPVVLARYLEGKANALRQMGRSDEARQAYEEALQNAQRAGDADREASVRSNLSLLDLAAGRAEDAAAHNVFAAAQARRLGNDWLLSVALSRLAEAHLAAAQEEPARAALAEAQEIAERHGYAELLWRIASIRIRMSGDGPAADAALAEGVDLIERLASAPGAGRREDMLANLAAALQAFDGAGEDRRERRRPTLRRLLRRFSAELVLADTTREDADADADTDDAAWARDARHYVATNEPTYLHRASDRAQEPTRAVLTRLGEHEGMIPMDEWEPAVRALEAQGAQRAASALNLAAIAHMLRVTGSPGLTAEADRVLTTQCHEALSLAEWLGFTECRAALASILGARAVNLNNIDEALWHLFTAAKLFGRLARAEPTVYRRAFALALNSLAGLYRLTSDVGSAAALHRRATAELTAADGSVDEADLLPLLAVLHDLARIQTDEHDAAAAAATLGIAFRHWDAASDAGRNEVAMRISLLRAMARVHNLQRQLAAARALEKEAAELARGFGPPRGTAARADLAASLNALGATVAAQDDHEEACALLADAVRLARESHANDTLVSALANLAGVHSKAGRRQQADVAYREAIDLQRPRADEEPEIYEPRLVELLVDLGTLQITSDDLDSAGATLAEAVERGRRAGRRRSGGGRRSLVAALDRLGAARAALGADTEADALATEAVRMAEGGHSRADAWLWKGWAVTSYHRLLTRAVEAGDSVTAHACLAALREAAVAASEPRPEESLVAAAAALARIESSGGPRLRVVVAERLDDVDLMGVLDKDGLRLTLTHAAVVPARGLYDAVDTVFEAPEADGRVSEETLAVIAAAVLAALPDPVREVLADRASTVLVSGDPYWTTFPWEALCTGSTLDPEWLGLELPLPRSPGLTAAALAAVCPPAPVTAASLRTASVVCPWDAVAERPLEEARDEAVEVARLLTELGYTLVPDGAPLLGPDADAAALRRALAARPAVIHYSGHAEVVGGEEVLLLAGPDGVVERFGTGGIAAPAGKPLLPQAPLVVLNGCRAGHARAFGGRREDLLSTFLAQGAAAVVASAFPMDEVVGRVVGTALYRGPAGEDVGAAVIRVRRILAASDDPLARALWRLLTCHGNPLTRLP